MTLRARRLGSAGDKRTVRALVRGTSGAELWVASGTSSDHPQRLPNRPHNFADMEEPAPGTPHGSGDTPLGSRRRRAAHVNEVLSKAFPDAYASGQRKAYQVPGNGMSGIRFMAAVIAMLEELRGLAPLTAEGAAARFSRPRSGHPEVNPVTAWRRRGTRTALGPESRRLPVGR